MGKPRTRVYPRKQVARLLVAGMLATAGCSRGSGGAATPPDAVRATARSLAIIRSATPARPRVLKILFYGQSISNPKWTDRAMATLRAAYPAVRFDYRNLALGGWSAAILERAAARDMEEAYPDLIVFHVYGDHRAYERIIRTMRARTAADVIIETDHVVEPVEPVCETGLHLRWSPPPGCKGHLWFRQNHWEDYMSGRRLPELAARYGLALEPRRQRWNAYLQAHHLAPAALIADAPHPNDAGWALMARLFTTWFAQVVAKGSAEAAPLPGAGQVATFPAPVPGTTASYDFTGNRIELLAAGPLDGRLRVSIDGKPPQAWDGCWQTSRVSRLANVPDWPALKQVTVDPASHHAERWTVRVSGLDSAQDRFAFTLADRAGAQGSGTADTAFTSTDGQVRIDPQDWMLAQARVKDGRGVAEGATFTWDRHFACRDEAPVALGNGTVEQRHVLATGLPNARHRVQLTLAPGAPRVREVRAYRPPL